MPTRPKWLLVIAPWGSGLRKERPGGDYESEAPERGAFPTRCVIRARLWEPQQLMTRL